MYYTDRSTRNEENLIKERGIEMAKFDYEDKQAFTVVGIGVELKSDYMDQAGINKEKKTFSVGQ